MQHFLSNMQKCWMTSGKLRRPLTIRLGRGGEL
jgi:hypothetical protein